MGRRRCHLAILLSAAGAAAVFAGCRPSEELDPHLRPKFKEADVKGVVGDPCEEIVKAFVELGVFDSQATYFDPDGVVDRGTFVTWLVRAWNIYHRDHPKKWIRLAQVTAQSTWTYNDVMPHTPLYPYLQGMIDAGVLVAFEKGEWDYSHTLKREQLILLRNAVVTRPDRDAVFAPEEERDDFRVALRAFLADADSVSEPYLPAVAYDCTRGESIALAFPDVDLEARESKPTLGPARQVKNREAVFALSKLGDRTYKHASVSGLGPWEPLPEDEQKALDEADQAARKAVAGGHEH
ncbi:MAG: hypothetical protein FJX74_15310 [Armatimonadetes bacterium]|nr:hypothetical protein [Armatimonadota bacterium]